MTPHEHFSIIGHNLFAAKLSCSLSPLKKVTVLVPAILLALGLNALLSQAVSGQVPSAADSDQDGVNNYRELRDGSDPNDPKSHHRLSKGLVAYYPFDGNANDESGHGMHGTVKGAELVANRYGVANKAYNFGGSAWIETGHRRMLDGAEEATITAWVWIDPRMVEGQLLAVGDFRGGMDPISFRFTPTGTSQVNFQDTMLGNTGPAGIGGRGGPHTLPDLSGGWHLIAVVLAKDVPASSFRIFVDGYEQLKLVGSDDGTSAFRKISYDRDMPLVIGALEGRPAYGTPGQFWIGDLDDIRVYNRALTPSEIAELFHAQDVKRDSDGDGLTDSWERGAGRYRLIAGNFIWHQARADAEKRGGRLATITSEDEWRAIKRELGEEFAVGKECWVGATDEAVEGVWSWITGERFSFAKWRVGEPSGHSDSQEDYASIFGDSRRGHAGEPAKAGESWNDDSDATVLSHYLMEFGYPSDPRKADTDGDGHNDKKESEAGTDPNDAASYPLDDRKRPVVTVERAPKHTKAGTMMIKGFVTDNVSPVAILYRVESPGSRGSWSESKLPGTGKRKSWQIEVPLTKQGVWKVRIRAIDDAGNLSTIKTVTVVADRRSPAVGFLSRTTASSPSYELKAILEDNAGIDSVAYQVKPPGGNFSPWSEKIRFADMNPDRDKLWKKVFQLRRLGKWQFNVRAYDVAGNPSRVATFEVQRR